jgi:ATP-dependent Lon protease
MSNKKNIKLNINKRQRSDNEDNKILKRCSTDIYFKNQDKHKQIEILNIEDKIYNYFNNNIPLRYKILYSTLPIATKSLIIQKIDFFESITSDNTEYSKLSKWLNELSQIPFDNYIHIPVSYKDNHNKIQQFLLESYEILCKTIYGQNIAKNKIMQILAQWISNPLSTGQIIALEGPPGVGKTCLIKNGVSNALKRPFCFYALGGATDISNLEGHSYTYEGAICGRIVEMLIKSKVMNPVIFFDELDKISDTPKGNEIISLLTHLTDPSQNNIFHDKYFDGIDIDISKCILFFSFNDIKLINPILKDRLTIIKFEGYNLDEKIDITRDFIIPEILKNVGFQYKDIIFNDNIIKSIIIKYTDFNNEKGVRNIKRIIEDLILKINLLKLTKNKNNLLDIDYNISGLQFPLIITNEIINNLLK